MEQNELVVMYTDGVTESFSPEDEIFGEERLQAIILDVVNYSRKGPHRSTPSAADIVPAMDSSVERFTGDSLTLDDLTWLSS